VPRRGAAPRQGPEPAPAEPPSPFRTRDEALRALLQAAEVLRRGDPQSPVPYVIVEAVRLARLELPALLSELLPDEGARSYFRQSVGLSAAAPADNP
jgi:type VI secretion system protein ImpA